MNSLSVRDWLRLVGKRLLFPGLDLHTRSRYRFLTRYFKTGHIDTLDAGCGNGALSYAAYRRGNRVLGVTMEPTQVRKDIEYFSFLGTDPDRLKFEVLNLYDLPRLDRKFDQIICSETLEHISRHDLVVQYFHELLREGGVLHICCPSIRGIKVEFVKTNRLAGTSAMVTPCNPTGICWSRRASRL